MIRPIVPDEWLPLIPVAAAELLTRGLYSGMEIDALLDPSQHESSWLPDGKQSTIVDLGLEVDAQIVGMLFVHRREDGVGVLEALFVHPERRAGGNGRLLVRAGIQAVRDAGLETVEIFAMDREPEAIAFWRHLFAAPPNRKGVVEMLGGQLTATGWHLKTADVRI